MIFNTIVDTGSNDSSEFTLCHNEGRNSAQDELMFHTGFLLFCSHTLPTIENESFRLQNRPRDR